MMANIFILSLLLIVSNFVNGGELRCYNCDPTTTNQCLDVTNGQTESVICEVNTLQQSKNNFKKQIFNINKIEAGYQTRTSNKTVFNFECYSIYVQTGDSSQSGVHRGCFLKSDNVKSTCDLIKEESKNDNITACETCQNDECNTVVLKDNNNGNNGNLFKPVVIILINAITSLIILNFN